MTARTFRVLAAAAVVLILAAPSAHAQVGKSQGVVDANTVPEAELAKMPHMTPAIAKALVGSRPFKSITELNTFLIGQGLKQPEAMDFYQKAFVHINLNTATNDEILLVPGAGQRMTREFAEYRPWKSWAQFDKEIGKYIGAEATAKLAQYCFIPMNLNTASDEDLLTIPGAGPRMLKEFKEYRPWKSWAQFDKEIGKYVDAKEVARLKRYLVIE